MPLCAAQSSSVKLTLKTTSQGRLRLDVSGFPAISKGVTIGRHPALRNALAGPARACLETARRQKARFVAGWRVLRNIN